MARRNKDEDLDAVILTSALPIPIQGYIAVKENHQYYNSFLAKAGKVVMLPFKITIPNQEKEQISLDLEEVPEPETK